MKWPLHRFRWWTAFTLVELLAVIGVVVVLLSLLAPAMTAARRVAKQVQCASNLRQVSAAVLQYAQAHRGRLPPAGVAKPSTIYPKGFSFAAELVRLRFIATPNLYNPRGGGRKDAGKVSVFRCPEGMSEQRLAGGGWRSLYPTDRHNDGYLVAYDDPATRFAVATWYVPFARLTNATGSNRYPVASSGALATPFVWYRDDAALTLEPGYTRNLSMVRRASEVVMLTEGNTMNPSNSASPPALAGHRAARLAARHGKRSAGGTNAWTNLSFFDGHVAAFPTERFDKQGFGAFRQETIFFLNRQR